MDIDQAYAVFRELTFMADIRWFGHNCFRIRSREATIIMDPVGKRTGYSMTKQTADIVTISHSHEGHTNTDQVKPEFVVLDGPGEYELHGVFVYAFRTSHEKSEGADRVYNNIFSVVMDGIRFTHLGDLGEQPSDEIIEELEGTDVIFVPVGGGPVLGASEMAELVGLIAPKIVIPMQFKTGNGDSSRGDITDFAKHLSLPLPEAVDKLTLKTSTLGETMELIVLTPSS